MVCRSMSVRAASGARLARPPICTIRWRLLFVSFLGHYIYTRRDLFRRRRAQMCFLSGCGGGARKLVSKALPWVLLVTLYLLGIVTPVSASLVTNVSQSVSSAVQEPLLTEEVVALQEIATALKRSVELLSKNWSWIKVSLFAIGGTVGVAILAMFTGVVTLYLVDRGRKEWLHWKSLRPSTLEDAFSAHGNQVAAPLERMATTIERYMNGLQAAIADLRVEIADLRADQVHNRRDADGALEIQPAAFRVRANQWNVLPAVAAVLPMPRLGIVFDGRPLEMDVVTSLDESLNSSKSKPYNKANADYDIMPHVKVSQ